MKAAKSFPPALLVTLNLFCFAPFLVFSSNRAEFLVSFTAMARFFILPAALLCLSLALLPLLFGKRLFGLYLVLLFSLGLLFWIQGNFITWNYGPLNGQFIDWQRYHLRAAIDVLVWLIALGLAVGFRTRLIPHISALSIAVIVIQLISAAHAGYQEKLFSRKSDPAGFAEVPEGIYQFSTKANVVQVILDGFQSDVFQEIIDRDPQWRSRLTGFTFFPQATAPYSNTFLSLPALWSGELFTNHGSIRDYMSRTLTGTNIPNALHARGYRLDIATGAWWVKKTDKFANYYQIPAPFTGNRREFTEMSAAFLLDLALFRCSPQPLKERIYNGQSWFLTPVLFKDARSRFEHLAGNAFLRDLTEKAAAVGDGIPIYKFIHVVTPHPPLVVEQDCGYSRKVLPLTRENFTNQAVCTLKSVGAFLDRLRQIGVYDSSLIMVHADHGTDLLFRRNNTPEPIRVGGGNQEVLIKGAPFALLLVKPPGAKGEMRVSDAEVELTDLPATVSRLMNLDVNFGGTSVFEVDTRSRSRKYFGSENDGAAVFVRDSFDYLQEVLINGSVFDPAAWQMGTRYSAAQSSQPGRYNWNTKIIFDRRGDVHKYMEQGWSLPEEDWAWTDGKRASLRIPVSKPGSDVKLTVNLVAYLLPEKLTRQRVGIWANERQISEWEIRTPGFHDESAVIPAQTFDDSGQLTLRFELPDSAAPADLGAGGDIRSLAIAVHSLELNK